MRYTPKQIEKYQRQKYISFLEKITKNLFKMFRNRSVTQDNFLKKFYELKYNLDKQTDIKLYSEYHEQLKSYIENLYRESKESHFNLNDIREINMTQLNRLQKLKNSSSYKKDKHKHREKNQDWG
jgi:hypothetical protein